jgi:small-conductance mechanosensitive channel
MSDLHWNPELARQLLNAAVVFAAFLAAMLVVRLLWARVVGPLLRRTRTEADDIVLLPVRSLVLWGLFATGLYQAALTVEAVGGSARAADLLSKFHAIVWVALAIWTTLRIVNGLARWYAHSTAAAAGAAPENLADRLGLGVKIVNVTVLVLGALYALSVFKVNLTPLLAGGAVGGLALALALQDTLSNLFSGIYLAMDKPISVGDFIRLESGEEGFVEEIGWRSTRIRPWANNVVVIPNSKLSQSVVLNYYLPQPETSVYVPCGISYDSDLEQVEQVAVEVAREVMAAVPGSALSWEPVVRWQAFGDSSISFTVVLRVTDFTAQYKLRSDFIKALHRRFREEGIEIPFPIRTIRMQREDAPQPEESDRFPADRVAGAPGGGA